MTVHMRQHNALPKVVVMAFVAAGIAGWLAGPRLLHLAEAEEEGDDTLIDDTDPFGIKHEKVDAEDDGYYRWRVEIPQLEQEVSSIVAYCRDLLEDRYKAVCALERRYAWLQKLYNDATKPAESSSPWLVDADGFLYLGDQDPALIRELRGGGQRGSQDPSLESVGRSDGPSVRPQPRPPSPEEAVWGPVAIQSNVRRRQELKATIDATRNEQKEILRAALAAVDELIASVDGQAKKSARRSQTDFDRLLALLRDERILTEIKLYDAAGWYGRDELPALIARARFEEAQDPDIPKLMNARVLLRAAEQLERDLPVKLAAAGDDAMAVETAIQAIETNRAQGCNILYGILERQPTNQEARLLLVREEQHYLKMLLEKLEQERKSNLDAFYAYLSNRGFDPNDRSGWYDVASEYASAIWSVGPATSYASLEDWALFKRLAFWREDDGSHTLGVEGFTSTSGDEIARDNIALLTIRRLLQNGLTVRQVKDLSSDALLEQMEPKQADARPLSVEKARKLAADIHATFRSIPELQDLADGKIGKFHLSFRRPFYETVNAEQSWPEYLADCFNVRNLVLFLAPNAITKVGGKWVWISNMGWTGSEVRALESLGQVERLQATLAGGLHGLGTRFAGWFQPDAAGKAGRLARFFGPGGPGEKLAAKTGAACEWLQAKIMADRAFMDSLSTLQYLGRSGARMIGVGVLYAYGGAALEEMGIPHASILVDIIASVGAADIVYDALTWSGRPIRQLVAELDRFGKALKDRQDELGRLAEQLKQAKHLNELKDVKGSDIDKLVAAIRGNRPYGTLAQMKELDEMASLDDLIRTAAGKLKEGKSAECYRAIQSAGEILDRCKLTLVSKGRNLEKALNILRQQTRANPLRNPKPVTHKPIGKMAHAPILKKEYQELFQHPEWGKSLQRAHEYFRKGKFQEALREYGQVHQAARRIDWRTADDKLLTKLNDFVEEQMTLIWQVHEKALAVNRVKATTARLAADAAITEDMASEISRNLRDGSYIARKQSDGKSILIINAKTNETVARFKKILDRDVARLPDATPFKLAQDECVGNALYNKVSDLMEGSSRAPAARPMNIQGSLLGEGDDHVAGILFREVKGDNLLTMIEPEVLSHHDDLEVQRIFRAWIGDTDGHLGNVMRGTDGRLWVIDFGYGEYENAILRQTLRSPGNSREYVEAALKVPYAAPYTGSSLYQYMVRLDGLIHPESKATLRTIEAINRLSRDEEALRKVLKDYIPPDRVDKAVEVLRDRAKALWDAVNAVIPKDPKFVGWRFQSPAIPIALTCRFERRRPALAA